MILGHGRAIGKTERALRKALVAGVRTGALLSRPLSSPRGPIERVSSEYRNMFPASIQLRITYEVCSNPPDREAIVSDILDVESFPPAVHPAGSFSGHS